MAPEMLKQKIDKLRQDKEAAIEYFAKKKVILSVKIQSNFY